MPFFSPKFKSAAKFFSSSPIGKPLLPLLEIGSKNASYFPTKSSHLCRTSRHVWLSSRPCGHCCAYFRPGTRRVSVVTLARLVGRCNSVYRVWTKARRASKSGANGSIWWGNYAAFSEQREPDRNLLRNAWRPYYSLIDICRIIQLKFLPLHAFLISKFFIRGKVQKIASFFHLKTKLTAQSHLTSYEIKGDFEGYFCWRRRWNVF